MKVITKLTVSFALVFTLLTSIVDFNLYAQTLQDLYDGLEQLKADESTNEADTKAANTQIANKQAEIEVAAAAVISKQEEIATNETEIASLEADKETKSAEIADLMLFYQTTQTDNIDLAVLANTDSIVDAIHLDSSVELLTAKSDEKIDEFTAIQADLETKNAELTANITELETLQTTLAEDIEQLNIDIRFLQDERVDIDDQIADQENLIAYYEDLGCEIDEDLEACKNRNAAVTPMASGFTSPMEDGIITSFSGWYSPFGTPLFHTGTDMVGYSSKSIYASAAGTVAMVGSDGSRGNYAYIHHVIDGVRYTTAYFHMASYSSLYVGQSVTTDSFVGTMGNTGFSTGAHLHFEILSGWIGQDFYYSSQAYLDVRNFLSYPGLLVYWSGRIR